jgi:hypothetical protein
VSPAAQATNVGSAPSVQRSGEHASPAAAAAAHENQMRIPQLLVHASPAAQGCWSSQPKQTPSQMRPATQSVSAEQ